LIASLEAKWRHWHQWSHVIQICPVYAPDGALVLGVLSLRLDLFDAAGVPASEMESTLPLDPYPEPRLFDLHGVVLAELPRTFPDGIPSDFRVVFTDWHDGFPRRIEMRQFNAAVLGTFDLPTMIWNATKYRYEKPCRRVQKVP